MSLIDTRSMLMISTHGYVAAHPELGRPDTGGQVVYVLELAKHMARRGFRVDIGTRLIGDQPAIERVAPGVRILRFPCGGPDFIGKETLCDHIPQWVEHALEFFKANRIRYDFINSHYWDAGLAGESLAAALDIPHLHTPHSIGSWKRDNMHGDPVEQERRYNFRRRIRDERRIYHGCAALIATTPQQLTILQGKEYEVPAAKVRVVPPGFDENQFFPVSEEAKQGIKRRLHLEGKVVLALGRLARNKGYDLLIRSMRPVFERVPEARLVLAVGSTHPNDDEVKQLAALKGIAHEVGHPERVDFRDYIPDEELADYYRGADVFALSSRYEPFGMTAIEAMACGTPTVVTTEGGLWEQITWGVEALYADPNDPESFGHMLTRPLMFPAVAAQLGEHGAAKAKAQFTWGSVSRQIIELSGELHVRRSKPAADAVHASDGEEMLSC